MHIKNIHCMVEKLAECAKREVEKGIEQLNTEEMGEVTDMLKDLCEAEYYARIAKAMEKSEEDDKAEEKYMMKMLKEENKEEYKRMREEYGEDEGERRFYDNYRYASGRFAPKGRGSYRPRSSGRRRGYDAALMPEDYSDYEDYLREGDWMRGKMHYTDPVIRSTGTSTATASGQPDVNPNEMRGYSDGGDRYYSSGGNTSGGSSSGGSTSGNYGGSSTGGAYTTGGSGGMGYSNDYSRRDYREGRSGQSRRTYMEKKEMHPGNSMEDNKEKMESLDSYLKELGSDITEMVSGMSQKEKDMLRGKLQNLSQKIQ